MNDIKSVFNKQKEFFYLGKTNDINFRIDNLRKLKEVIKVNENKILEALNKDLGKSNFESYATEIGIVYDEIDVHIKNIKKWARRERKKSSIIYYPSKSYVYKEPYGVTLIIGPFNYPFQLVIAPLIGAISAGNTAIIKPSENTKNISIDLRFAYFGDENMFYEKEHGGFHVGCEHYHVDNISEVKNLIVNTYIIRLWQHSTKNQMIALYISDVINTGNGYNVIVGGQLIKKSQ